MARSTFVRRTIRNVIRGTSWLKSVGRYNERFSRIFRAGKWRPACEGSLWMSLFGVKASPLSLVGTRRRDRNKMSRLLRVEALESKQLLAADVFVNDNWVELVNVAGGTAGKLDNGDVVDNSADVGEAPIIQVFGITAFSSIQDGVDIVDPAGTVHVLLGSYTENVIVDQSLHLSGAGESKVTIRPAISGPGVGEAGSLPVGPVISSIVLVQASDVEISDITFDGDNTSLTSGAVVGGADIDARNGIITDHNLGLDFTGLDVHDVTVQNVYLRGIQASTTFGSFTFADNTVSNVQGDGESVGIANIQGGSGTISGNVVDGATTGISTNFSLGTTITGNTVRNSVVGIASNNNDGTGGTSADVIGGPSAGDGNLIEDGVGDSGGILVYIPYLNVVVQGNTVNDVVTGLIAIGGATGGSATFIDNTVSRTSAAASTLGAWVTNEDLQLPFSGDSDTVATFSGNKISGYETGMIVEELVSATAGTDISVSIPSGSISGGVTGLILDGDLSLVGNTLGTLALSGQSGDYITLSTGALDDQKIDALAVTFDGLTAGAMTPAGRTALETRLTHEPDDATLGLLVTNINDAPDAKDDAATTAEDTKVTIIVLANDTDADQDKLTVTGFSGTPNATVTLNPDGTFIYDPIPNFNGPDSFTYTVSDGTLSDTAKVTVTVTPVNDAPNAVDDPVATTEDTPVTGNVLANDTDPDGDTLKATLGTGPSNGTLVFAADGKFTYTPNSNFSGTDSFTYTADDSKGGTDTATVSITVSKVNDAPVAKDDAVTTDEDTAVTGDVLANDVDPDGDTLTVTLETGVSKGTLVLGSDGKFTYTPGSNFNGADSFTYKIDDGKGGTDTATVSITVNAVNDPPVAVDDKFSTTEDTKLVVAAPGVLGNDTDVDGGPLTAALTTGPTGGSVIFNSDGSFTYTPNANFNGADKFTYTVNDGAGGSDVGQVDIAVGAVNDAPVAAGQTLTTGEDTPLVGKATATDAEGDVLTFATVTGPTLGTLIFSPDGSFTYTPATNKSGADSFTFQAKDATDLSNVATISISITAVNDPPDAVDDKGVTDSETPLVVDKLAGLLSNDSDPEGAALTVASVNGSAGNVGTKITLASGALVTVNADGSYTYDPNGKFGGLGAGNTASDSFTYQASDGSLTDTATVKITITGQNEPPDAVNDTGATDADDILTVSAPGLLGNDVDPDVFDTLSVSKVNGAAGDVGKSITLASGALLTVNSNGSYTYNPNGKFDSFAAGKPATDFFTYTAADSSGEEDSASVTITVTGVNDAPVVNDQAFSIAENSATGAPVGTVVATDVDADTLTYVLSDSGGAFAIDSSGQITVANSSKVDFETTPAFNLMVTVSDPGGFSDTAKITINVTNVNDPPTVAAPVADVSVNEGAPDMKIDISGVFADQDAGDVLTISVVNSNAAAVTATLSGDSKSLTLDFGDDKFGTAEISLTATDKGGAAVTDKFTVNVANINDPVDAKDDFVFTLENKAVSGNVLANDFDPDGDTLTAFLNSTTQKGTLSFQTNGSFTYTPNAGFAGNDTFTYTASDGKGSFDSATVTITVANVNQVPDAKDDAFSTLRNTAVSGNVLANDVDADGDKLFASLATSPANGNVVLNSDGNFSYTPNSGFVGTDSFTYKASDGLDTDTAKVEIKVTAPVGLDASDDSFTAPEDTVVTGNLLANDIDPEGDAFSLVSTTAPSSGTLITDSKGNFTYTPFPNFFGTDSFNYTIQDAKGVTDTAKVTLTFTPVNDVDAVNDAYSTKEDVKLSVAAPGVLANDFDPDTNAADKHPITGVIAFDATSTKGGTVAMNPNGSFDYTPAANFQGTDTFTYTISDGFGASDTATVTIAVGDINDPPDAVDDPGPGQPAIVVPEDSSNNFIPVLANDTDIDGNPPVVTAVTPPSNGAVTIVPGDAKAGGGVRYTPNLNFFGVDTFKYTISDGRGGTDTATVTVTVSDNPDVPSPVDDKFTRVEDTTVTFTAADLTGNDFNPDKTALAISKVLNASGGTVVLNGDGSVTFDPNQDFTGDAKFEYEIVGGSKDDRGLVTITYTPVNDPPTVGTDVFATNINTAITVTSAQVLSNDSDPEGGTLSVVNVSNASGGTVILNPADGKITFSPANNFTGTGSFNYTVSDGQGAFATGLVIVNVEQPNRAPDAKDDLVVQAETDGDVTTKVSITPATLVANDTDPDGDALTLTAFGDAVGGTITQDSKTKVLTFETTKNFVGDGSFTYTVSDGRGGTDKATVTVRITNTNDAPVAVNDAKTTPEDTKVTIDVLANDTDPDLANPVHSKFNTDPPDKLTVISVSTAANGQATIGTGGVVSYTPNNNFTGTDSFTYTISDTGGKTSTATVTVMVTGTPDVDARNDSGDGFKVNEDTIRNVLDVLKNDVDPEGDTFKVTGVTQGAKGIVEIGTNGANVLYTPDPNFIGSDMFTYTITDSTGASDSATVTVEVVNVGEPPDAVDDAATVVEDSAPNVINVLANDKLVENPGGSLTITKVTQGKNGTVQIRPGGADLVYQPNPNFAGSDSFTYTITDNKGGMDTATVTVTVQNTPDAPDAKNDTPTVVEGSKNNVIDVLANDVDPEGGKLTVTKVTQGTSGTVAIGTAGANVIYTPNAGFSGSDIFTYTITDPEGSTDTATVLVTVTEVGPDFKGGDGDDVFYVKRDASGTSVQVFANDTGTGTPIFTSPMDTAPRLTFDTMGGNDRLIVDAVNGNPIPTLGIAYAGGANGTAGDRLTLRNGGITIGTYRPSASTSGSGVVTVSQRNIDLTGVEPIDVNAYTSFTVVTPNASDTLTITRPATDAMQIAGTSGAITMSPVTLTNVSAVILDAATNDGGGGNDSLTINASGDVPSNVGFMEYRSGTGANTLTVQNGAARIDSTVAAGGSLDTTVATGAEVVTHRFRQNGLTLANGGRATILSDPTNGGTSVVTSLSVGTGSKLDINDNALLVNYTGASPEAAIRAKIIEGRGGVGIGNGNWTGTGITSSAAAAANALNPESRSIGYANNGSLPLGPYTTFRGQPLDATTVIITFTVTADADLDGKVDDDDVTITNATYAPGVPQPHWALGDFDYNNFVNDDDVTLVGALYKTDQAFSHTSPAPLMAAGDAAHAAVFADLGGGSGDVSISASELAAIADEVFAEAENPGARKWRLVAN